jgi:hypothetical protein
MDPHALVPESIAYNVAEALALCFPLNKENLDLAVGRKIPGCVILDYVFPPASGEIRRSGFREAALASHFCYPAADSSVFLTKNYGRYPGILKHYSGRRRGEITCESCTLAVSAEAALPC